MTNDSDQQPVLAPGSRLRCEKCGAEAIILQPGAARLACCDTPLVVTFDGARRA